jgi:ABC-2 type transport system ATP-binding protein
MSIKLISLSKAYGNKYAVKDLNFEVKPNEIVGFLGPNGAGKTTTMKMITGYLEPTAGKALVCGHLVSERPLLAQAKLGYLPEQNPLYYDLYVSEFLRFSGGLYGLKGPHLTKRIADVVDQTGIGVEKSKKIGQLSKGYKQRVGLAHTLLHEPEVLILDEPTTGLDPNQLEEIRNLIKTISIGKTILLSTHIMQEVEAICTRVILLSKGTLVADFPVSELKEKKQSLESIFRELTQ